MGSPIVWRTRVVCLVAPVVLVVSCTSGTKGSAHASTSRPAPSGSTSSTPTVPSSSADLTPSTQPAGSDTSSPAPKSVDVVITRAAWDATSKQVSANAIVPGTLTPDGTCTLTLTMGTSSHTASRTATEAADSTQCGVLTIDGSTLQPGNWTAVVSFSAPGLSGTSNTVPVTVTS